MAGIRTLLLAGVLGALLAGCSGATSNVRLSQSGVLIPAFRAEAEVRYNRALGRRGFEFPAIPGTEKAFQREQPSPGQGNRWFFRGVLDVSHRAWDDSDLLKHAEEFEDRVLGPGEIRCRAGITREVLELRGGLLTGGKILHLGVGIQFGFLQLRGELRDDANRVSLRDSLGGIGPGFLVELSPGFLPLRAYFQGGILLHLGLVANCLDMHFEIGLKVQYVGFMAFCGYRKEGFDFFRLDTDLRLTLDGPVAGVGLVF